MSSVRVLRKQLQIDEGELKGGGATGKVYLGYHGSERRPIAVKVINLEQVTNEVTRYLLACEIAALNALANVPGHVIHLLDTLIADNRIYLAMELMEGGTVANLIVKNPNGLPPTVYYKLFKQLLEGYKLLKGKSIVHRDLKPQNLLFTNSDQQFLVIIDFGYCTIPQVKDVPQMCYNVGSPKYMSPEAYKKNEYSQKSDMWAIGIIFYEMIVGYAPSYGQSIEEYFSKLKKQPIVIPSIVPQDIAYLITLLLSLDPIRRPSCEQALQLLQRCLATHVSMLVPTNDIYLNPFSPSKNNQQNLSSFHFNCQNNYVFEEQVTRENTKAVVNMKQSHVFNQNGQIDRLYQQSQQAQMNDRFRLSSPLPIQNFQRPNSNTPKGKTLRTSQRQEIENGVNFHPPSIKQFQLTRMNTSLIFVDYNQAPLNTYPLNENNFQMTSYFPTKNYNPFFHNQPLMKRSLIRDPNYYSSTLKQKNISRLPFHHTMRNENQQQIAKNQAFYHQNVSQSQAKFLKNDKFNIKINQMRFTSPQKTAQNTIIHSSIQKRIYPLQLSRFKTAQQNIISNKPNSFNTLMDLKTMNSIGYTDANNKNFAPLISIGELGKKPKVVFQHC